MTDLTALKYTAEHEWVALDGDVATVGITSYAADKLGDVVFVELPAVGSAVTAATVTATRTGPLPSPPRPPDRPGRVAVALAATAQWR